MDDKIYLVSRMTRDADDDLLPVVVCYTEIREDAENFCELQNYPENEYTYYITEIPKLRVEVKIKYIIGGVEYA